MCGWASTMHVIIIFEDGHVYCLTQIIMERGLRTRRPSLYRKSHAPEGALSTTAANCYLARA